MGEVLLSLDLSWYSKLRQIRDLPEVKEYSILDILHTPSTYIPLGVFSNRDLCWNYICHYLETSKLGQFFKSMLGSDVLQYTAGMKIEDQYIMTMTNAMLSQIINISFKDLREALLARSAARVTWQPPKTRGTIYYIHRNSDDIFTFSKSPEYPFRMLFDFGGTAYVAYLDHGCGSNNVNQCKSINYDQFKRVINGDNIKEASEVMSDVLEMNDVGGIVSKYLTANELANIVAMIPKRSTARRTKPTSTSAFS